MPERLSSDFSAEPSWDLDRASHVGPELSSKISAASILYSFLRNKERGRLSSFLSALEEFRHTAADNNPQGGYMCGRFDILDQLTGVAYVPQGNRTPQEKVKIARATGHS